MNYITFKTVEIVKPYLFKEKTFMKENKNCFNMYKNIYIYITLNIQNKIIIWHWDVELAMIFNVFIFQVFVRVLVPTCEHSKEKITINGDLLLKPFKNIINSLSIYNIQK